MAGNYLSDEELFGTPASGTGAALSDDALFGGDEVSPKPLPAAKPAVQAAPEPVAEAAAPDMPEPPGFLDRRRERVSPPRAKRGGDVGAGDTAMGDLEAGVETLNMAAKGGDVYLGATGGNEMKADYEAERAEILRQIERRTAAGLSESDPRVTRYTAQLAALDAEWQQTQEMLTREIGKRTEGLLQSNKDLSAIPLNPAAHEMFQADSFSSAWDAVLKDPYGTSRTVMLRSLPAMAPGILLAGVGSLAGPAGTAVGAGAGEGLVELGSVLADELLSAGIDLNDSAAVQSYVAEHSDRIMDRALTRAGAIAAGSAAGGLLAGKMGQVAANSERMAGRAAAGGAGIAAEVAGGMGGETLAQVGDTGGIEAPGEILAEGLGEVPMSIPSVAGGAVNEVRNRRAENARNRQEGAENVQIAANQLKPDQPTQEATAPVSDEELFTSSGEGQAALGPEPINVTIGDDNAATAGLEGEAQGAGDEGAAPGAPVQGGEAGPGRQPGEQPAKTDNEIIGDGGSAPGQPDPAATSQVAPGPEGTPDPDGSDQGGEGQQVAQTVPPVGPGQAGTQQPAGAAGPPAASSSNVPEPPDFETVRQMLPKDENGDPDVGQLAQLTGNRPWGKLSDDEKRAVVSQLGGETSNNEPSVSQPTNNATEGTQREPWLGEANPGTQQSFRMDDGSTVSGLVVRKFAEDDYGKRLVVRLDDGQEVEVRGDQWLAPTAEPGPQPQRQEQPKPEPEERSVKDETADLEDAARKKGFEVSYAAEDRTFETGEFRINLGTSTGATVQYKVGADGNLTVARVYRGANDLKEGGQAYKKAVKETQEREDLADFQSQLGKVRRPKARPKPEPKPEPRSEGGPEATPDSKSPDFLRVVGKRILDDNNDREAHLYQTPSGDYTFHRLPPEQRPDDWRLVAYKDNETNTWEEADDLTVDEENAIDAANGMTRGGVVPSNDLERTRRQAQERAGKEPERRQRNFDELTKAIMDGSEVSVELPVNYARDMVERLGSELDFDIRSSNKQVYRIQANEKDLKILLDDAKMYAEPGMYPDYPDVVKSAKRAIPKIEAAIEELRSMTEFRNRSSYKPDASSPVNDKPATGKGKRLVLMPCSGTKKDGKLPAGQKYDGPMWQTFRNHGADDAQAFALSAKHGWVETSRELDNYDQKMTKDRSDELVTEGLPADVLAAIQEGGPYDEILIAGGGDYRSVMNAAVNQLRDAGAIGEDASIQGVKGGIGEQRQQLGEWLDLAESEQEASSPSPSDAPAQASSSDQTKSSEPATAGETDPLDTASPAALQNLLRQPENFRPDAVNEQDGYRTLLRAAIERGWIDKSDEGKYRTTMEGSKKLTELYKAEMAADEAAPIPTGYYTPEGIDKAAPGTIWSGAEAIYTTNYVGNGHMMLTRSAASDADMTALKKRDERQGVSDEATDRIFAAAKKNDGPTVKWRLARDPDTDISAPHPLIHGFVGDKPVTFTAKLASWALERGYEIRGTNPAEIFGIYDDSDELVGAVMPYKDNPPSDVIEKMKTLPTVEAAEIAESFEARSGSTGRASKKGPKQKSTYQELDAEGKKKAAATQKDLIAQIDAALKSIPEGDETPTLTFELQRVTGGVTTFKVPHTKEALDKLKKQLGAKSATARFADPIFDVKGKPKPKGNLGPTFNHYSFANYRSVFEAAFTAAGIEPDVALALDPAEQVAILRKVVEDQLGMKIELPTRTVIKKNIAGRQVRQQRQTLNNRMAIDQLLDAFRQGQMMMHVLGQPMEGLGLKLPNGSSIKLVLEGGMSGYLGMFNAKDRSIHMPDRTNSFAHEWFHALDSFMLDLVRDEVEFRMETRKRVKFEAERKRLTQLLEDARKDEINAHVPPTKAEMEKRAKVRKKVDSLVRRLEELSGKSRKAIMRGHLLSQVLETGKYDEYLGFLQRDDIPLDRNFQLMVSFGKVMQSLFGDKAKVMVAVMDLQRRADEGDAKAKEAVAHIKAGRIPEELRNKFAQDSEAFDNLVGQAYFRTPWEMLARAGEAYIARKVAEVSSLPQSFLTKGEWAYDGAVVTSEEREALIAAAQGSANEWDMADAVGRLRLDMTYPRGVDGMRIAEALDDFFTALREKEVLGPGKPAEQPSDRDVYDSRNWDRYHSPKSLTEKERRAWKGTRARMLALRQGASRAAMETARGPSAAWKKAGKTAKQWSVTRFKRQMFDSMAGQMRILVEAQSEPRARRALRDLADRFVPDIASGRNTGWISYESEVEAESKKNINRFSNIVERFELDKLDAAGIKRLHQLLTGNEEITGSDNVSRGAAALRRLLDSEWYRNREAGIDVGYARNGFLPRFYDQQLAHDDRSGFVTAAAKVYKDVFQEDVRDNNDTEEQMIDLRLLFNRHADVLQNYLDEDQLAALQGAIDLDQQIKALTKTLEYSDDPDAVEAQIEELSEELQELMGEALDAMELVYTQEAAKAWLSNLLDGSPTDYDTRGPGSQYVKKRTLPKSADKHMRAFMRDNPLDLIPDYMLASAKRVAYVKRAGAKNEVIDKLIREASDAGASPRDTDDMRRMIERITGRSPNSALGKGVEWMTGWIHTIGTIALLGRAAWSSFAEPIVAGMRTGYNRDSVFAGFEYLTQVWRRGTSREREELARAIGLVTSAEYESAMHNRMGGDFDPNRLQSKILGGYFLRTGLTGITNYQRKAMMATAHGAITRLLVAAEKGGEEGRLAQRELNELGIPAARVGEFLEWLRGLDGLPSVDDLYGPNGQFNRAGQLWANATNELVLTIIQNPRRHDRPEMAAVPGFRLMYGIMSFQYAFHRNILRRTLERNVNTKSGIGKAGQVGANFLNAGPTVLALFSAHLTVTALREFLFNPDKWEEKEEEGGEVLAGWLAEKAFYRMGLTGAVDPLVQWVRASRYERSSAGFVAGAQLGFMLDNIDTIRYSIWGRNSGTTNTGEHNAIRSAYQLTLQPAAMTALATLPGGPFMSAIYGGAIWYGSGYGAAYDMADTIVGEKGGPADDLFEWGNLTEKQKAKQAAGRADRGGREEGRGERGGRSGGRD